MSPIMREQMHYFAKALGLINERVSRIGARELHLGRQNILFGENCFVLANDFEGVATRLNDPENISTELLELISRCIDLEESSFIVFGNGIALRDANGHFVTSGSDKIAEIIVNNIQPS